MAHLLGSDRLDTLHGAIDVRHLIPVEHALASTQCGGLHTLRCHEQLAAILAFGGFEARGREWRLCQLVDGLADDVETFLHLVLLATEVDFEQTTVGETGD